MSKTQFYYLHKKLSKSNAFQCTSTGKLPVNSEKCLLIGIWVLATPDSYRSIASRFAVSKSTVFICVQKVIEGLLSDICTNAIKLPRTEGQRQEIAREFEALAGMRNVVGAMDGSHVTIIAPRGADKLEFYDRKKRYSIVLHAVCDANLFFTNVDVRWWPGSVHDARALRTSDLYPIAPEVCATGYHFIGDSAYPLKTWLMRPYKRFRRLNRMQKHYNKVLSRTRQVIERAFGTLKNKWRRLFYLHRSQIKYSVQAIVACCVLHNICNASDEYTRVLIFGEQEEADVLQEQQQQQQIVVDNVRNAKLKRQDITDYLWQHRHD